ncbi:MAG TPA: hypothetical protein VIL78_17725 [Hanamia sp.]
MNTLAFKLLNPNSFKLKVNPLLQPFNVIKELLLFKGIPYEIWIPDYNKETTQWNYSFIEMGFCRGCNFQDVYLLTHILKDFGLTFIYPSKDNTKEIFLGTNINCLENPENLALRKPMHIQDFFDIDPKLKIEEIIDLFSDYPYSNDQGYTKEEMQQFDKEYWEGSGEEYSEEDTFDALTDGQLGDYEDFEGNMDDVKAWAGLD